MSRVRTFIEQNRAAVLLSCVPLLVALCFAFFVPRPYAVQQHTDIENDYYYNAQLLVAGQPTFGLHHPGTPIYTLFALVMEATGSHVEDTQTFFNVLYMLIGALNTASLFTFFYLLRGRLSESSQIIIGSSIIAWPSFLFFLNYAGSDSFTVAAFLIPFALFWRIVADERPPSASEQITIGLLLGLNCAIKYTALPLAAVFWFALLPGILKGKNSFRQACGEVVILPLALLGAFIVATLPLVPSYAPLFGFFVFQILLRGVHGSVFAETNALTTTLLAFNPFLVGFAIIALLLALTAAFVAYQDPRSRFRGLAAPSISIALWAMVLLQNIVSQNSTDLYVGNGIRYLSPAFLIIPFAIWYSLKILQRFSARLSAALGWSLALCGVISIVWSIGATFSTRVASINHIVSDATAVEQLVTRTNPGGTIAISFLRGDTKTFLNATFHFFGNRNYAFDFFDDKISASFPGITFLHDKVLFAVGKEKDSPPTSTPSFIQSVRSVLQAGLGYPRGATPQFEKGPSKDELFTGNAVPGIIVISENVFSGNRLPDDVNAILTARTHAVYAPENVIVAGERWLLLKRSNATPTVR